MWNRSIDQNEPKLVVTINDSLVFYFIIVLIFLDRHILNSYIYKFIIIFYINIYIFSFCIETDTIFHFA